MADFQQYFLMSSRDPTNNDGSSCPDSCPPRIAEVYLARTFPKLSVRVGLYHARVTSIPKTCERPVISRNVQATPQLLNMLGMLGMLVMLGMRLVEFTLTLSHEHSLVLEALEASGPCLSETCAALNCAAARSDTEPMNPAAQ